MKHRNIFAILFILISIAGCMSPEKRQEKLIESKKELLENPGSTCNFTINKNYIEVVQIIKAQMMEAGLKENEIITNINEDIEKAELTIEANGLFEATTIIHFEIKALSQETSECKEYYFYKWKYEHNHLKHCDDMKNSIENYNF